MSGHRPSRLTASAFELLIRAYWSPSAFEDWVNIGAKPQAAELVSAELAMLTFDKTTGSKYQLTLTERGTILAEFILDLPLPEAQTRWVMPGYPAKPPPADRGWA